MHIQLPLFIYELGTPTHMIIDKESAAYDACDFNIKDKRIKFRRAKVTPVKAGVFVVVWKRSDAGEVIPYDNDEEFDYLIICISDSAYFIFPKSVLVAHKILSHEGVEGKRAFRIYTPDDENLNKQALKTRNWQQAYYYCAPNHGKI